MPADARAMSSPVAERVVYELLFVSSVVCNDCTASGATDTVTGSDCHTAHHRSGPRLIQYPPGLRMRYNTSMYSCTRSRGVSHGW